MRKHPYTPSHPNSRNTRPTPGNQKTPPKTSPRSGVDTQATVQGLKRTAVASADRPEVEALEDLVNKGATLRPGGSV